MRSLEGLIGALTSRGTQVRVVTTDGHGHERLDVASGWSEWQGVPVLYLPRWFGPDATPRMFTEVLRAARAANVVHVTGLFCVPTVLALAAAALARRPAVLSPRGALEAGSLRAGNVAAKRAWLGAFRALLRTTAVFHATSEKEEASIRAALGDDVVVRVIPNGTNLEPSRSALEPKRGGRATLGALGRIHPNKGYDRLLGAAAILLAQGLDVEVAIAGPEGDGVHLAELEAEASRLGIRDRVRFVGEVYGAEKSAFFRSCRVLAMPSHDTENFGNVVIEALAEGTPVVASQFAPWSELETLGAGRWVPNTPAAFAEALAPYVRDADLATRQGSEGNKLVARKYTWAAVAEQMLDAYAYAEATAR